MTRGIPGFDANPQQVRLSDGRTFSSRQEFAMWLGANPSYVHKQLRDGKSGDEVAAKYRPDIPKGWGWS